MYGISFSSATATIEGGFILFFVLLVVALVNQHISEGRKLRNERLIGQEKNDAVRAVGQMRNASNDELDQVKHSEAQLKIDFGQLGQRNDALLTAFNAQTNQIQELMARNELLAQELSAMKKASGPSTFKDPDPIGTLGDPGLAAEEVLEDSPIVSDDSEHPTA